MSSLAPLQRSVLLCIFSSRKLILLRSQLQPVIGRSSSLCVKDQIPRLYKTEAIVYIHVTVHRNRFLFNNQPDPLIIPILFCYKTLHVSGIFSVHHQEFSTVHSAVVSLMRVFDDRFQEE
jgi:hypothetical protein